MKIRLPEQLNFISARKAEQKKTDASLEGKICVISGATSGVGLAALKELIPAGAYIIMIARDLEKADHIKDLIKEKNPGSDIDILFSDFKRLDTVREAASIILKKYTKVHILINSAGVFYTSRDTTPEGLETVFCVNHLAPFLLTRLLADKLIASAPSRVIQVNSQGHRFGGLDIGDLNWEKRHFNGYRSYGASKTAQLLTVWKLSEMFKNTGVTINAMHPGAVKTNIGNNNGPLYRWYSRNIIWHFLGDPKISGEAIYYLAASKELKNTSGRYFNLTIDEKPAAHALDMELAKKIWKTSEKLVAL